MGQKEFKKKFMHPTRRKLAEMVHTGEYETDTKVGWTPKVIDHEIGDVWEDENHKYERKEGYTIKTSKNAEALQAIRDYLEDKAKCKNKDCKQIKKSKADITLIAKTGYCTDCLNVMETEIKAAGIWKEYSEYKIWGGMISEGKIRLDQMRQAHKDMKQVYEYVNEDGTLEKWTLPQPVEQEKAEMMKFIESGEKEVEELVEQRNLAFNKIKEQNYEHYL